MNRYYAHHTTPERVVFVAFAWSEKPWKPGFTTWHGQKPRERSMAARDQTRVLQEVAHTKQRCGLPETALVVSCYEAAGVTSRIVARWVADRASRRHRQRRHRGDQAEARLAKVHMLFVRVCLRRARGPGNVGVIAVHIRPQRMRHNARVDGNAGHVEAEVRAVAHVDPEPPRQRFLDHGVEAAVRIHKAPRMARERMGQHVTRFEEGDQLRQNTFGLHAIGAGIRQRPELAEMDIDGELRFLANPRGQLDDRGAPAANPPISAWALMPLTRSAFSCAARTVATTSTQSGR